MLEYPMEHVYIRESGGVVVCVTTGIYMSLCIIKYPVRCFMFVETCAMNLMCDVIL